MKRLIAIALAIWLYPASSLGQGLVHLEAGLKAEIKDELDTAIAHYSLAIEAGDLSTGVLSFAFTNRGNAYRAKSQYDRAIEDYNVAIHMNLYNASAFNGRGFAYSRKGQYDRAIEDYDNAIRLSPDNANFFKNRARAHFYLHGFAEAQPDMARAVELNPADVFAAIWLYLARGRAGQDGRGELDKNAGRLKLETWPGAVVKLYLGKATGASVLSAAKDADPKKDKEQHCEAYFYLGQHALLRGDRGEAIRLLKAAIDTGVTNFVEYTAAQVELERLAR